MILFIQYNIDLKFFFFLNEKKSFITIKFKLNDKYIYKRLIIILKKTFHFCHN